MSGEAEGGQDGVSRGHGIRGGAMTRAIHGLHIGAFTVLVGQDERALADALRANPGAFQAAMPSGLSEDWIEHARRLGRCLAVVNLFDSVHPTKVRALVASLRKAGVPVIAATHNVYVLDACDPGEVIAIHDGQAARVSEHPEATRMTGMLSAGQIWSLDDEGDWVPAASARRAQISAG